MDFTKLFDLKYITDKYPTADTNMILIMSVFFVLVILVGLMLQISIELQMLSPIWRSFLRKVPGNFYIFSIFGLLLLVARHEESPFLSMRLFLLLLLLGLFSYIVYKAIYFYREYPRRLRAQKK